MPRTPRGVYCPVATKKTRHATLRQPLLQEVEAVWPGAVSLWDSQTRWQEQQLCEAVAPYVCLAELRWVAASSADIQSAVRQSESLPE